MGSPSCTNTVTVSISSGDYTQCDIVVRPLEELFKQRYVLQFAGSSLADFKAKGVAVDLHGDGTDPHNRGDQTDAWARDRGYLLIKPVGHDFRLTRCWGCTQSLWHWRMGLEIGRDLQAFGNSLDTDTFMYWGHSGGSWFLSDSFIGAGINLAPDQLY